MSRDEGTEPTRLLALQADAPRASDCTAAVRTLVARWGRLDVLVNNVGISGAEGTAVEVDEAEWSARCASTSPR